MGRLEIVVPTRVENNQVIPVLGEDVDTTGVEVAVFKSSVKEEVCFPERLGGFPDRYFNIRGVVHIGYRFNETVE